MPSPSWQARCRASSSDRTCMSTAATCNTSPSRCPRTARCLIVQLPPPPIAVADAWLPRPEVLLGRVFRPHTSWGGALSVSLLCNDVPIAEVASRCGFAQAGHFGAPFSAHFWRTPERLSPATSFAPTKHLNPGHHCTYSRLRLHCDPRAVLARAIGSVAIGINGCCAIATTDSLGS
jgi:AraC-like DNA-binding protein